MAHFVHMTPRRLEVLEALKAHWREHRMGPTVAELAAAVGVSETTTLVHLRGLKTVKLTQQLGAPGVSRRWAPVDPPEEAPRDA